MLCFYILVLAVLAHASLAFSSGSSLSAFTHGLYGLNPASALFFIESNGTFTVLSPELPYLIAQQLSTTDASRGIFYFIGYSRATSGPYLVGLSLANGSTLSETALPEFYDAQYIGIGQYVAIDPTSTRVFVGGQDVSRNHIVGLVTPGSGEFEVLANLSSSLRDVFGGTSVFVPQTNELWFELDLDIMILNMATKKVDVLPVSADFEILGMHLDPTNGLVYGLGGGPGQGVRSIVALNPKNRTITAVGTAPDWGMQMGGITAYNNIAKSVFWLGQKAGADPTAQWYMVQNAVNGGKTLSFAPLCGNAQLCPWSLHYA
jgi:hypothetical protein